MRILQANTYHFLKGGAERYYLDLSEQLTRRGHEIIPFATRNERNLPSRHAEYFVRGADYRANLSPLQRAREALHVLWSLETSRNIRSLVHKERPDIAHLHNVYHQLPTALILALDHLKVPMVHTLHDYKAICPGYLLMTQGRICERCRGGRFVNAFRHRCLLNSYSASLVGWVEAELHRWMGTYSKATRLLCPSRFLLEKLVEFGIARERVAHLPHFLPVSQYTPSFEPSDAFIYAGRLSPEKGIPTLLRALRIRLGSRLTCRILGEGPLEADVRRRIEGWNLKHVELTGFLQGEALHQAIRSAAFTVVPSESYENLPYAILESFALGTPVVASRIGGIPEMVTDHVTGLMFPAGDAQALAREIDWMEAHPQQAVDMGRRARTLIERDYAPGPHLERIEALYRSILMS